MAKAILEYNINDPDDLMAHKRAIKSDDMAFAIWDIVHNIKKKLEWSLEEKEFDKYETLELVFENIHEVLNDHNVDIEDLVH